MLGIPPKFPRVCGVGAGLGGEDEHGTRDDKVDKEQRASEQKRRQIKTRRPQDLQDVSISRRSSGELIADTYIPTPPAYSTKIGLIWSTASKPIYDDEYYENLASEKMVQELIEYLQNAWNLYIEKKSSMVEVTFRTMDMMHHKKPPNYWLEKRARQKVSDFNGFFANVRKPYDALGAPTLDTPALIFDNMPEQLRIDGLQWFLDLEARQEEERRRNAPLPKAPRHKVKRPKYGRGRIRRGAGGTDAVDKFVHTAETFQRQIRGTMTFTKLLEAWKLTKEDEAANRGSPFGILHHRETVAESFSAPTTPEDESQAKADGSARKSAAQVQQQQKRQSSTSIDDRIYQHQMLHLEKMMTAMYDILKSLLNMKHRHVRSQYKLPLAVVTSLRSQSPDTRTRNKSIPQKILDRAKGKNSALYKSMTNISESRKSAGSFSVGGTSSGTGTTGTAQLLEFKAKESKSTTKAAKEKRKCGGTRHVVPTQLEEEDVQEILPLDDQCDKHERKDNMEWIRSILDSPSYLDDRPAELKSDNLKKEGPSDAVKRNARNDHRYKIFFDRKNLITPTPQWHDVKLESLEFGSGPRATVQEKSLHDFALLDFAGKNIDDLPFTAARPNPDDIPTPKLPNARSLEVIDAEEQSRLNLLAKCPGADDTGPVPQEVQRLYHEAGIKTTTKDMFRTIMKMKKAFNDTERKVRTYYLNEIEKFEWNTLKRYKTKIAAIQPAPVFEWSIAAMRQAKSHPVSAAGHDGHIDDGGLKHPSVWYKHLLEKCREVGALKHHGCKAMLRKLQKYCDIDIKSRPNMLNRYCLLVLSLPTTELGTPFFQEAILFLLDRLFGSPKELFYQWLRTRGLPSLI